MTVATAWPYNSGTYDQVRLLGNGLPQRMFGGVVLVCVAACAWTSYGNVGAKQGDDLAAPRADRLAFGASRSDRLPILRQSEPIDAGIAAEPFDSRFSAGFPSGVFLGSASFAVDEATAASPAAQAANTPSRRRRLAYLESSPGTHSFEPRGRQHGGSSSRAAPEQTAALADAPAQQPSIFEKLFGGPASAIFERLFGPPPSKVALAYAASTDGVAGDGAGVTAGLYDRQTAVYVISAHTVYMPDGTTLEAHSGLGSLLDLPRYANEKDRGPTPPHIYDLRPREQLFHGVRALQLIPLDQSKVFGRTGLLAHSYMLGPNGQSNGCVSFKDYDAFLQAYEKHEITRLAVVSHID
jgi:type VI secretion system (T6SS) effector TldE1-like protein